MSLRQCLRSFTRTLPALALAWVLAASAAPAGRVRPPANEPPGDIMLTQVRLDEAVRLLAQVGKTNIVVTGKVSGEIVSLYLRDSSVDDMIRNLCRAAGVWYRYDSASKTYLIMSGEEYQKDLAIVRDEETRIFTLRHHNVVSTANAIRALFGSRVQLVAPVEEMPPTSLGSGSRTSSGGSRSGYGSRSGSRSYGSGSGRNYSGGGSGSGGLEPLPDTASLTGAAGFSGGAGASSGGAYDPSADLDRLGMDRLQSRLRQDAGGEPTVSITEIQELAARQGPPIYVTYNRLNNLLLVRTGDEAALRQIALLVGDMDRPPRQVLLEMKILEVTLDDGFRSVFDIGASSESTVDAPQPGDGGPGLRTTGARNALSSGLFDFERNATFIWQAMSSRLSLRFQLLAEQNKLKVLSSPMLVAANNQPARLFIGDERVLTVGASSESLTGTTGATNTTITVETETRDVGQTLSILPRINGDRSVSLTIDQDSSTVKIGDATIPVSTADGNIYYFPIDTVNTAALQVTAHAQDGMTVAIGGMIRDSTQYEDQKVPVLGDLPLVGALFKRDVRAATRTQIVLLITPRVLDNPGEADALAREKTQGYEALTGTFPDKPIVPAPAGVGKPAAAPVAAEPQGEDAVFAALARAAAAAVRQSDPTAPPPDGLLALPVAERGPLALANGMQARVAASWIRDGLYVTALRVVNIAPLPDGVAPTLIPGRFAAMILERTRLEGAGGADSWTWAYAVSRLPFEEAVERP
jgi:general secretion pathway protein D